MFRAFVVLASLISAAAFAPVARRMTSSSLKMSFEGEAGVVSPTGFFDPLGMIHSLSIISHKNPSHLTSLIDRINQWY